MIELNGKIFTCSLDVTLSLFEGKWKLLILYHLYCLKKRSYSEIKASHPGISEKMLSQQLKEMERDGLVAKKQLSVKPNRVEYYLTDSGSSLSPMYEFVADWGVKYLKQNDIDYSKDKELYSYWGLS